MINRYLIILSFTLITLLVTGAVELLYNYLGNVLIDNQEVEQTKTKEHSTTRRITRPVLPSREGKTSQVRKDDYTIINKRNLFGKIQEKTKRQTHEQKPVLTTTSLDMTLLGTIGGEADDQRAIIRTKSSKNSQEIYFRGDAIEHALIKDISRGKIILTVDGKDEILLMEETKSPPSTGKTQSYYMPDVYTPADINEEKDTIDDIEEDGHTVEKSAPPVRPRRRMTLKPKKQQVAEP